MQIYLVGGAIRDRLLGRTVTERDWLIVGATAEQMLARGYRQVGQDFPVFLHPETNEEYALARTERKIGLGYRGFSFSAANISLEQDLARRDLSINAIAEDQHGQLHDPYGGLKDLEQRILRHVSPAFAEDPVRILRLARFAARYSNLGFRVADETLDLCRQMVASGEVDHLTPERIWREFDKALNEAQPVRFIEILRQTGALKRLMPELEQLFGIPNPARWHPEVCSGIHSLLALQQASELSSSPRVRFAALLHDLGKALTPAAEWPSHHEHEQRGVPVIQALCQRLKVPNDYRDLAVAVCQYHTLSHRAAELKASTQLKLLQSLDALRRPERFDEFLLACAADAQARPGYERRIYQSAHILKRALTAISSVAVQPLLERGFTGAALGQVLEQERIKAIKSQAG